MIPVSAIEEWRNKVPWQTNEQVEQDKDPVELFVEYKSILPEKNLYISKRIKIEISCSFFNRLVFN